MAEVDDDMMVDRVDIPYYQGKVAQGTASEQYVATRWFRMLLSSGEPTVVDEVVQAEPVVQQFVEFLGADDNAALQFEAMWALTNICSGSFTHVRYVVGCGAVPRILKLLLSPMEDIVEQAAWCVSNIAADSVQCRNFLLQEGAATLIAQVRCLLKRHHHRTSSQPITRRAEPPRPTDVPTTRTAAQRFESSRGPHPTYAAAGPRPRSTSST